MKAHGVSPKLGIRVKIAARGAGRWELSGGARSKFGLFVPEVRRALDYLDEHDLKGGLDLLHFHLGSQISDIQQLRSATKEMAQIYAELRLRGIPVGFFYLLLLVLVAVTVVLLIQVVGLILVLALLTLPAAMAGHHVHSLGRMMLIATLLGGLLSLSGLALSYGPDLPAGPVIILLAGAAYVVSALFVQLNRRRRSHGQGERNG